MSPGFRGQDIESSHRDLAHVSPEHARLQLRSDGCRDSAKQGIKIEASTVDKPV